MEGGVVLACCSCGTLFEMNAVMNDSLRKTGKSFFCPSGHPQSYTPGPTEAERLQKELDSARRSLDVARSERDFARTQYRCCVAGCDFWRNTKSAMRKHLEKEHQIREDVKRLPEHAGKNASNSDVGA